MHMTSNLYSLKNQETEKLNQIIINDKDLLEKISRVLLPGTNCIFSNSDFEFEITLRVTITMKNYIHIPDLIAKVRDILHGDPRIKIGFFADPELGENKTNVLSYMQSLAKNEIPLNIITGTH